jgi:transcription antitermination factor NusG
VNQDLDDQNDTSRGSDGSEAWYALQTRVHRERIVELRLQTQGVTAFVPVTTEIHRWSDRRKSIEVPIFSSYVFVRTVMNQSNRRKMLTVDGVSCLVGNRGQGTPDSQ